MDKLKQQGRWNKLVKSSFKTREKGSAHIKEKDYGKVFDLVPITNSYLKKLKQGLKVEYRAVKRGENHKVKQEIESILLDETGV